MTEALLATTPTAVLPTDVRDRLLTVNGSTFRMVPIPGGVFNMGDETGDLWDDCRPVHPVRLDDFCLGQFPVTQALWRAVVEALPDGLDPDPSFFKGDNRPVEQVSWADVQIFIKKLNALLPGRGFRLPTEAEWEYAARAVPRDPGGAGKAKQKYSGSDSPERVAWWYGNSYDETKPVGLKLPNALGIFDMSGNVWEWCEDWYDKEFYEKCAAQGTVKNPMNAAKGSRRVLRGGSWFNDHPRYCRVAYRRRYDPTSRDYSIGFWLAASPPSQWRG